jgi:hypothetical protein
MKNASILRKARALLKRYGKPVSEEDVRAFQAALGREIAARQQKAQVQIDELQVQVEGVVTPTEEER